MSQHIDISERLRLNLPVSRPAVATLVGDVLAIAAFVVLGEYSHDILVWEMPLHALETLAPFLIAWALVAPIAGVYRRDVLASYQFSVALVALAWLTAAIVGTQIRATEFFHGGAAPTFVLVSILVGAALLVPWRIVAAWLYRRSAR